ncbi:MAG: hypothetical protein V1922_02800 [bacterium]
MDGIIDFVVSINKIALLAFFAVFGFLVYEVKKMFDEKKKKEKPVVPQFNDKILVQPLPVANSTPLPPPPHVNKSEKGGSLLLMIIIGVSSLIGVVILIVISYKTNLSKQKAAAVSVPIVREITSAGLKVYDTNWVEIESKKNDKAKAGEKLYIGIQTIVEADIDRARIKVNSRDWQISDITTLYNPARKVYYKEYIVASGTAQLKIDAQLHSASDGWLGD